MVHDNEKWDGLVAEMEANLDTDRASAINMMKRATEFEIKIKSTRSCAPCTIARMM